MPRRKSPHQTCLLGTHSGTGDFVDLSDSPASPPAGEFIKGMWFIFNNTPSADVSLVLHPPHSPTVETTTVIDGKYLPFFCIFTPHPLLVPDSPSPERSLIERPSPVQGHLIGGGTGSNDDLLVISCGHCEAHNLVETSKDYFYVVFKGKGGVGIYRSVVS